MRSTVVVVGLPYFAARSAEGLRSAGIDATYVPRPGRSPLGWLRFAAAVARARVVYAIGVSAARGSPADRLAQVGKHVVLHWVGTDVLTALDDHRAGRLSSRLRTGATHWADASWLAGELRPLGIEAVEHPLPVPLAVGVPLPLPPEFRVAVYLPASRHPAHDLDGTLDVIRALPDIPFVVVGGYPFVDPPPNLDARGFVSDMPAVYRECTALLRLVRHDGLSHSVVEALSFGRHVVWGYELPGVTRAATPEAAVAAIRALRARWDAGTLEVNEIGATAVTARYAPATIASELARAFAVELGRAKTPSP